MANRYENRNRARSSRDYDDARGYSRQQEQFEQGSSMQYGDAGYDEYHDDRFDRDFSRGSGRQRMSMRNEGRGDYNALDQYEADQGRMDRRYDASNHASFRGDSYGGEPMSGPEQMTGGGSFFPGGTSREYRDSQLRRSSYRNRDERGFFDKAGDEIASWFGDDDAERRREMDHRGRGPSNYTRSNERILEDACDRLTDDRGVDARNIQVTVDNGEVTLDGTVNTRWEKRRAEDCVHDASGVNHVQNNLRVEKTDMRTGSTKIEAS